ncbi:MAG: hypothetical protein ACFB00_00055 [Parvularculaceae bacterium]
MVDKVHHWDGVKDEVCRVVDDSVEPFAPSTIRIAFDVLLALRDRFPVPEVSRGYWPTIRFCWPEWEIEIHRDTVEIYRFSDKHAAIQEFDHTPGAPLSNELSEALESPSR